MQIISIVDGNKGTANVRWIEETQYSSAHYEALISVPYQSDRWVNLFVYDKDNDDEAVQQAEGYLKSALLRCTLF